MKTHLPSALMAAVAALALGTAAYAQQRSDDGIAASPKVRQTLTERRTSAPVGTAAMACEKCADLRSARLRPQAKGAEVLVGAKQATFTHGCASCETKLTIAGEGKARHQVATHTCGLDVAGGSGCCVSN